MRYIKNFMKYRYLLVELTKKTIKLKYRRSYLGILWTLVEPLLTMMVLAAVFGSFLEKGGGEKAFPVYILTGRLLYTFFSNGTKTAMKSIQSHSAMIKKVYIPKYIYPLSSILSNYIIFLISLIVLLGVSLFFRIKPTKYLLYAIVPLFLLFVMTLGVGMILATASVFFRDLEYLWSVALMMIMYTSAIFYKAEKVADKGYGWLLDINPLYSVIVNFRNTVYLGTELDPKALLISSVFSFSTLIIGVFVFYKKQDQFILHV